MASIPPPPYVTRFPSLFFRFSARNLPLALLLTLLQRTPALRVGAALAERFSASPVAHLLRSAVAGAAAGTVHTLAGATTLVVNQGAKEIIRVSSDPRDPPPLRTPAVGEVGTAITPIAFAYIGNFTAQYFVVRGQLPDGLTFSPAPRNGILTAGFPVTYIVGTPVVSGNFTVSIQGGDNGGSGSFEPINFVISTSASATLPVFTTQPSSQTVVVGSAVTLTANASGSPAPAYQWRRDGAAIVGATNATLTLPSVQLLDSGSYSVLATNAAGSVPSNVATLTVTSPGGSNRLSNLSVRTSLTPGQVLTVGVVVDGGGARDILVRAAGPALAGFGLASAMTDPRLELFQGTTSVFTNDNWPASLAPVFASVSAFPFTNGSRDAAFVQSLNSAYSIQAQGTGPGIVLVEAYDTGAPTTARLVNVSARNRVGTGDDILIAGFAISGSGTKALLIRAVGPGLAAFGVPGTLVDPKLEIFNNIGVKVAENDNWSADLAATFASVGAFSLPTGSKDAALVTSLDAGKSYTVQVQGVAGGTGEALIEIYELR